MNQSTSWIWRGGDNIAGVRLDKARRLLHWTMEIGCHCDGDDDLQQSVLAYLQEGPPGGVPSLPVDVRAELEQALQGL